MPAATTKRRTLAVAIGGALRRGESVRLMCDAEDVGDGILIPTPDGYVAVRGREVRHARDRAGLARWCDGAGARR